MLCPILHAIQNTMLYATTAIPLQNNYNFSGMFLFLVILVFPPMFSFFFLQLSFFFFSLVVIFHPFILLFCLFPYSCEFVFLLFPLISICFFHIIFLVFTYLLTCFLLLCDVLVLCLFYFFIQSLIVRSFHEH